MELKTVFEMCCGGQNCPAVLSAKDGRIIVRGKRIKAEDRAGLTIGDTEDAVEVTRELLEEAVRQLNS